MLFHHATSFLAISQLIFMTCFYLLYYRYNLVGRLMVVYSICLIAFIVGNLPEVNAGPRFFDNLMGVFAIFAPALLWVITRYLFEDDAKVGKVVWGIIVVYMLLRISGMATAPYTGLRYWLHMVVPQIVMLCFASHVVYTAVKGRGSDLVELRRKLRVPFAFAMGSIVTIIVASGFLPPSASWLYTVYISVMFLLVLFFNLITYRVHRESPHLIDTVTEPSVPSVPQRIGERDKDRPLIEKIHAVMEGERLYAEHGLTIGELATRVSLQEYRLRRLINQKLHYRNFNQYLNHYRIAEAARRLQDPSEAHLPISSIALDVGYASLSSFNKAFKELHSVTPSSYRSRAQS